MEAYKDLLQMGFSFFVAAYLLIIFNQTLQTLTRKFDAMLVEIRHLNDLIMTHLNHQQKEGSPQE